VPFTLSHAAAALPFRRARLVPSALVFGTFAPDIEYFLRLAPGGGFGHTIPGAFLFSLPMGLVALWLFHNYVKVPGTLLLSEPLQHHLAPYLGPFRFAGRFLLIVASMLIGIFTHLVWDAFTHAHSWIYHHWSFLREDIDSPFITDHLGIGQNFELLQHLSSILGLATVIVWCILWFRAAPPSSRPLPRQFSPLQRWGLILFILILSVAAAFVRCFWKSGLHMNLDEPEVIIGKALVTFGAVLWWELVVLGLFIGQRGVQTGGQPEHRIPTETDR
jgi:hypothetical protein